MHHLINLPASHLALQSSISEYFVLLLAAGLPAGIGPTAEQRAEQHHSWPCPPSTAAVRTGSQPPPHLLLREPGEMSYNYTNKLRETARERGMGNGHS